MKKLPGLKLRNGRLKNNGMIFLELVSRRIVNEIEEMSRVVYDISAADANFSRQPHPVFDSDVI